MTGTTLSAAGGGGSGDVVGPASATDNAIVRFDSTTGKLVQNSDASVDDSGVLTTKGFVFSPSGTAAITIGGTTSTPTIVANSGIGTEPHFLGYGWWFKDPSDSRRYGGFGNSYGFDALHLASATRLVWSSGADARNAGDTGLCRNAAGVLEINNNTPGTFRDLKVRQHYVDQTITTGGTTGNQTINKAAGTVNIAAAGTTVTVTNSLCTTSSTVYAVIRTNDTTARIANVVPGAGSFVINIVACTNEVSIGFLVVN